MAANEHHPKEEEDGQEPAHHARRPMNAFLIFCKRHRAAVRAGFPNLENRAVTRVLGEWWAMLSDDQKQAYTNLAQEYKDAFLNANPDFKWYKLPAPPLRTLSTRPTNKKAETVQSHHSETIKSDYLTLSTTKFDEDSIQPGKLADESQIGGLSSLFTPQKVNPQDLHINDAISGDESNDNSEIPKPPKKRFAESPISIVLKDECKANLFGDNKIRTESNNNDHHLTNIKTESTDEQTYIEDSGNEENPFRSGRSCKGLIYQKFLAEQGKPRRTSGLLTVDQPNRERRNSISSNVSEKTDSLSSEGTSSRGDLEHLVEGAEGNMEASKPEDTETEGAEEHGSWVCRKRFKAEDFNLEKKIEALPSLSLEEFQAMKKQQRTKKKKIFQKVGGKKSNREGSPSRKSESQKEMEKAMLVGSQKRKARKQSITRNTSISEPAVIDQDQEVNKVGWVPPTDALDALACLAAVAANRTKLTKS